MSIDGGMPFLSSPNGFWVVVFGLGIIALLMILFFIRKKWL